MPTPASDPRPRSAPTDAARGDESLDGYRPISGMAIVGLLISLAAPLVFVAPLLLAVPLLAIGVNALALRQIARNSPTPVGRNAALAGLGIAVLCAAVAVSSWLTERFVFRTNARNLAQTWFQYLRDGHPERAFLLALETAGRPRLDDDRAVWNSYRRTFRQGEMLRTFVQAPVVRALLALGPRAQVRRYKTLSSTEGQTTPEIRVKSLSEVYAVTFEEAGKKRTFFVTFFVNRSQYLRTGAVDWQVLEFSPGIRP